MATAAERILSHWGPHSRSAGSTASPGVVPRPPESVSGAGAQESAFIPTRALGDFDVH